MLVVNVEPNENTERAPPLSNPEHRLNRGRLSRSVYRLGDHKSGYAQVVHAQRVLGGGCGREVGLSDEYRPKASPESTFTGIYQFRTVETNEAPRRPT